MHDQHDDDLPPELRDIAEQLRAERATFSPLELDQLKQRARRQAASRGRRIPGINGRSTRSRALTLIVSALLLGGTTAGAIAGAGGGGGGGSSAKSEYRPGKGCGDKHHVHTGPPGNPGNRHCPPDHHGKAQAHSARSHHRGGHRR
jgi:hypothetical protein